MRIRRSPACATQGEVKFAIDGLPLAQVVARQRLHAAEAAAQRVDVALGESRDVDADGQRLVHDAHGVELLEVVDGERADAAAAVDFGFDEPLALEHAHGFAERTAADAELGWPAAPARAIRRAAGRR